MCATPLEAEVRELRLIAAHKPRYNRRSRFPERATWLKLTVEAFPRLSRVRDVRDDGATYLGPFSSARQAELATAAVHEAFRLRQCTARLSPRSSSPACALAEMGRCGAPCDGRESVEAYARHADDVRRAMTGDARAIVEALSRKVARLADVERFEDAAVAPRPARRVRPRGRPRAAALGPDPLRRDGRAPGFVTTAAGRSSSCATAGWRARRSPAGPRTPRPVAAALVASAEVVQPAHGPTPAATAEETECVLRWLERPGVRLVGLDGTWASPAHGAGGVRVWADAAEDSRSALGGGLGDRRGIRPVHQPGAAVSRIAG